MSRALDLATVGDHTELVDAQQNEMDLAFLDAHLVRIAQVLLQVGQFLLERHASGEVLEENVLQKS